METANIKTRVNVTEVTDAVSLFSQNNTTTTFASADIYEFYFLFFKIAHIQAATSLLIKENQHISNFVSYRISYGGSK